MNASIRLLSVMAIVLFGSGCAAGTRVGSTPPRLVRERVILLDEAATRAPSADLVPLTRRAEAARSVGMWRSNATPR